MTLSTQGIIAAVQLGFFIPYLFLSGWLIGKHGFRSAGGGWRYITLLSVLRILGSACEIYGETSPSKTLQTIVFICGSIGLAPLLLQCTGLLSRANISTNSFPSLTFLIVNLTGIGGMAIAIIGAVKATETTSGKFEVNDFMVAGIAVFVAIFGLIVLATIRMALGLQNTASAIYKEHNGALQIIMVQAFSVPFFIIRIVYSCIGTFGDNLEFMPGIGEPMPYLGMSVLMEFIIVGLFLTLGILLPSPSDPAQYKISNV